MITYKANDLISITIGDIGINKDNSVKLRCNKNCKGVYVILEYYKNTDNYIGSQWVPDASTITYATTGKLFQLNVIKKILQDNKLILTMKVKPNRYN